MNQLNFCAVIRPDVLLLMEKASWYYSFIFLEFKGLSLNLTTIFTIRPAIRLRHTRIIRQEEKNVAMKIRGLFKLNEMARIHIPKIKKNKTGSEDKQSIDHQ